MTRQGTARGLATLLALPALLAACGGGSSPLPTVPTATSAPSAATGTSHPTTGIPASCPKEQPAPLPAGETRTVTVETPQGTFTLKIEADLSPIAAGNFVALAECGYYDGVVIHRIAPGFVIQGGDGEFGRVPIANPDIVGSGGPGYEIQDEPVTGEYVRGTVAMAKTSAPNSADSQFFIVLRDLGDSLAKNYQIFGHVIDGMDVVDAISNLPNDGSQMSLAITPVPMTKVTVSTP